MSCEHKNLQQGVAEESEDLKGKRFVKGEKSLNDLGWLGFPTRVYRESSRFSHELISTLIESFPELEIFPREI